MVRVLNVMLAMLLGAGHPDPGELFVLQWRIRVDQVSAYYDPYVGVFSDEKWAAAFMLSTSAIYSAFEPGVSAPFEAGTAHTFELASWDMQTYVLSIDGAPAIYGNSWLSLTPSKTIWGDGGYNEASLARWDYLRFGVVPEPSNIVVCTSIGASLVLFRTRARR
jgi:hypothetical protein